MATTPDDLELERLATRIGERLRAARDRVVTAGDDAAALSATPGDGG